MWVNLNRGTKVGEPSECTQRGREDEDTGLMKTKFSYKQIIRSKVVKARQDQAKDFEL